jgi:hypothetical protein
MSQAFGLPITTYDDRPCVQATTRGERRAHLEKNNMQTDPVSEPGKADTGERSGARNMPRRCAGVLAVARTQGKGEQHGKLHARPG